MKIVVCSSTKEPVKLTKADRKVLKDIEKDLRKKLGLKFKVQE